MRISKRWWLAPALAGVVILAGLSLLNASWLAAPGHGTPRVIAQRGASQQYRWTQAAEDDTACTARLIRPPSHSLIDNTLPSIEAAMAAGADVVEIDIRITADHQFVLFHDDGLACRTDGSGRVSERSVPELQSLDVGYGYTADDGKSYPLRGKGVGLMPTLADALRSHPGQRFLVQIKDGAPEVANRLVEYLGGTQSAEWHRLTFFGSGAPLLRLQELNPAVRTWSARSVRRCGVGYLETGWLGLVPEVCDDGVVIVPVDQAGLIWGWPNRFLARMHAHHTEVMLIAKVDTRATGRFSRLDTLDELSRVPAGFDGSIWTDQIWVIGPAVRSMRRSD
jgi:glycerophosphoryl diester phosphodiesterase